MKIQLAQGFGVFVLGFVGSANIHPPPPCTDCVVVTTVMVPAVPVDVLRPVSLGGRSDGGQ